MPSRTIRNSLAATALVLAAGCAGYHLGPTNGIQAGARTIQVVPFVNQTLEPRLTEPVTQEIRKRLQQDGTYRLETHDSADIVVTGVIKKFDRSELAFDPKDVLTVRDYQIFLTAEVVAIDRRSGKTNLNQLVSGQTTVRVGADLSSAERQAIPTLATDLARQVTALLVDGTW